MFAQERAEVVRRDAVLDEGHPLLDPGLQGRGVRIEIDDGDALRIDVDVPQQNGQRAPRDGAKADEQDSLREWWHLVLTPAVTGTVFGSAVSSNEPVLT